MTTYPSLTERDIHITGQGYDRIIERIPHTYQQTDDWLKAAIEQYNVFGVKMDGPGRLRFRTTQGIRDFIAYLESDEIELVQCDSCNDWMGYDEIYHLDVIEGIKASLGEHLCSECLEAMTAYSFLHTYIL